MWHLETQVTALLYACNRRADFHLAGQPANQTSNEAHRTEEYHLIYEVSHGATEALMSQSLNTFSALWWPARRQDHNRFESKLDWIRDEINMNFFINKFSSYIFLLIL